METLPSDVHDLICEFLGFEQYVKTVKRINYERYFKEMSTDHILNAMCYCKDRKLITNEVLLYLHNRTKNTILKASDDSVIFEVFYARKEVRSTLSSWRKRHPYYTENCKRELESIMEECNQEDTIKFLYSIGFPLNWLLYMNVCKKNNVEVLKFFHAMQPLCSMMCHVGLGFAAQYSNIQVMQYLQNYSVIDELVVQDACCNNQFLSLFYFQYIGVKYNINDVRSNTIAYKYLKVTNHRCFKPCIVATILGGIYYLAKR